MNLWVIRHAKSSWANAHQADFDRPLNHRGKKDGKRMTLWMRAQDERPQRLVSSDAVRARATTEFVRSGYAVPADRVRFDNRLYEASVDALLAVVREMPGDCASIALVGHNPGSTEFVNALLGRQLIDRLPTLGIAMLSVPPGWSAVCFGCAKFIALQTPKTLPKMTAPK